MVTHNTPYGKPYFIHWFGNKVDWNDHKEDLEHVV